MVREKLASRAAEIDRTAEFPWDLKEIFQEMGLLGLSVPEAYGGCYQGHIYVCLAVEEIARACVASSLIVQVQSLRWHPILIGGSEERKKVWYAHCFRRGHSGLWIDPAGRRIGCPTGTDPMAQKAFARCPLTRKFLQ